MIEKDDYDISLAFTPQTSPDVDDEQFLPFPVALVDILSLLGLAAWRNHRQDDFAPLNV